MLRSQLRDFMSFRSLRHKLMAFSIACILLPSIITMSVYNELTQDAVRKQAIYNSQESLMLVNGYVTNLLKSMLSIANYVQLNSDMNAYFKKVVSGQTNSIEDPYRRFTDESSITATLGNLASVGEKSYVTVLLSNGASFTNYSSDDYNPANFLQESWFTNMQTITGLQSYWIETSPTVFASEKRKNPYQLSVVRPLRSDNQKMYGVVIVTVMENQVNKIFQNLVHQDEVMLVDGSNRILSHRDQSQIDQVASYLGSSDTGVSSSIMPLRDDRYLVSEMPIQFAGWKLVSLQPYKTATVDISSIFSKVFSLQLISFLIFLLLLLYLLRHATRPLIQLGKAALAVQRGNLNIRTGISGPDEIGRLSYSFDQMLDKVKEMIAEVSVTQGRKRKAELAMLQAQINPHFLFNVLNSIRMKVMFRGDEESADMIGTLSKLLRMTIGTEQDAIPLHQEIDLVSDYLKLMNMRQKETVELQLEVAVEAFLVKVPRFCLQPVIENAMIHGLNRRAGIVRIAAVMKHDALLLSVSDNGIGMDEVQLQALRVKMHSYRGDENGLPDENGQPARTGHFSGIGLPNVYERMKMTFGETFRMDIKSEPGMGTSIEMSIPHREVPGDVQRDAG